MRTSRLKKSIVLIAVVVSGCAGCGVDDAAQDAGVYAAALDSVTAAWSAKSKQHVLLEDSIPSYRGVARDPASRRNLHEVVGHDSAVVKDFLRRTVKAQSVRSAAKDLQELFGPITIVTQADFDAIRGERDSVLRTEQQPDLVRVDRYWEAFHRRYPNSFGVFSLSAVGYNARRDHAVVYVNHSCGGLCGNGWIVALRRTANGWRVVSIRETWVA